MSSAPKCHICHASGVRRVWNKKGFDFFHCEECDAMFVHPIPSEEEIRQFYSNSDYHGWMSDWAESGFDELPKFRGQLRQARRKAASCFRLLRRRAPEPGTLLDIGCSAGFFLTEAQRAGWEVEGAELNPASADVARRVLQRPVHALAIEDIDLEGRAFDAVTAWDLIEHLPEPRCLLEFAQRALKSGGWLGLSTPNHAGLYPRLSFRVARQLGFWAHPDPPGHLYQFSLATVRRMLDEHGFDMVEVRHGAIPAEYGLGGWRHVFASVRSIAYFMVFIGPILAGPLLKRGDLLFILARKRDEKEETSK